MGGNRAPSSKLVLGRDFLGVPTQDTMVPRVRNAPRRAPCIRACSTRTSEARRCSKHRPSACLDAPTRETWASTSRTREETPIHVRTRVDLVPFHRDLSAFVSISFRRGFDPGTCRPFRHRRRRVVSKCARLQLFKLRTSMVSIVWLRRDLRTDDNPALSAAHASGRAVLPLFVWSPEEEGLFQPGTNNRWWLHRSLTCFQEELRSLGTELVVRRNQSALLEILELVQETQAKAVYFNHLYDPVSLVRDHVLKQELQARNIQCYSYNADLLHEPWEVLDAQGEAYTVFPLFFDHLLQHQDDAMQPVERPSHLVPPSQHVQSLVLEDLQLLEDKLLESGEREANWCPGTKGAEQVWKDFLETKLKRFSVQNYKADVDGTSRISPHLHFGEISARRLWMEVKRYENLAEDEDVRSVVANFLKQLGLREFSRYISFHFPFTHKRSMLDHLQHVPWNYNQEWFRLWREGKTGYPIVDAGMRNLLKTGWTHNHIRVLCATFLVKHLLLPWQWGMKYFWDVQIDADIEEDVLGWQYISGCLQDAHPFDFMYNLQREALRFDSTGEFTRKWVPELRGLPTALIHRPWEASEAVLRSAGVHFGHDYPHRIITVEESEVLLAEASLAVEDNLFRRTKRGASSSECRKDTCSAQASAGMTGSRASGRKDKDEECEVEARALTSVNLMAGNAAVETSAASRGGPPLKKSKS